MPDSHQRHEVHTSAASRERLTHALEVIQQINASPDNAYLTLIREVLSRIDNHEGGLESNIQRPDTIDFAFIDEGFSHFGNHERRYENIFGDRAQSSRYLEAYRGFLKKTTEEPSGPKTLQRINAESINKIVSDSLREIDQPALEIEKENDRGSELSPSEMIVLTEKFYSIMSGEEKRKFFPLDYSEERFIEAVTADQKQIPKEVDDRIIRSQHGALHSLMFSGGLDSLYSKYLEGCHENGTPEPTTDDQVITIKTNLASSFLEKIAQKNKEKEYLELESGPVTVGVEVEYQNYVVQELQSQSIYENLVSTMEEMAKNAQSAIEKSVYEQYAEKTRKRVNRLNQVIENLGQENARKLFDEKEPGTKTAIELDILNASSASGPTREITSRPARSYKTQLRELITAASLGGLNSEWGIHETFGRIKLTKDHTEFMDGLPIVAGSGLLDFDVVSDAMAQNVELGYSVVREKYTKPETEDDEVVYFPFHRARRSFLLEKLPEDGNDGVAVELRSLPEFKVGHFPKFARQIAFQFYFAHSVKSLQKEPSERTGQDNLLIESHKELMSKWADMLGQDDIELPVNEDKYIQGSGYSEEEVRDKNKYLVFLSKVIILGQNDPQFKDQARKLVSEFSLKIKKILDNNQTE
jgi:hypothetical protein